MGCCKSNPNKQVLNPVNSEISVNIKFAEFNFQTPKINTKLNEN